MPGSSRRTRPSESAERRDDLSRFLRDRMHEGGLSYRHLSAECVDPQTTMRLGFQWIERLAASRLCRAPEPWRLRALAAGLCVPAEVVQHLAARQWLGYEPAQVILSPCEMALYLQARSLPADDKDTLTTLVRRFATRLAARQQNAPK
jgi:hypothetical protein